MRMGQRILVQRKKKQWSQDDLARQSGVPQPTISRIESGTMRDMQVGIARRLARALGVSIDFLAETFEDEDEPTPGQPPRRAKAPPSHAQDSVGVAAAVAVASASQPEAPERPRLCPYCAILMQPLDDREGFACPACRYRRA